MSTEDDVRHKREQEELRRKRKAAKHNKSEAAKEKERKRREHTRRILEAQKGGAGRPVVSSAVSSSAFQALFDKRADGFLVDLKFRNAPPRPPVGPFFVGAGFDETMRKKWIHYRPGNSIELNHTMQLHDEKHLITTCAIMPSSIDMSHYRHEGNSNPEPVELDPADMKLLNWTGSLGDTGAEELKRRRELARHRTNGLVLDKSAPLSAKKAVKIELANKDKGSRVLAEKHQRWMKKTTYLTNDQTKSVHQFKSQALTKIESKAAIDDALKAFREEGSSVDAVEKSFDVVNKGDRSRQHPTKRGVTVVYDAPLLPDFPTWGFAYSNVIIDNLPKGSDIKLTMNRLQNAIIGDVDRKEQQSKKMECHLLVQSDDKRDVDSNESLTYEVLQQYDLDVTPLRDDEEPDSHFLFFVDQSNQVVTYHPIQSRVQLSSGRIPNKKFSAPMEVSRRALTATEKREIQVRTAEVDEELAYNLENQDGVGMEE